MTRLEDCPEKESSAWWALRDQFAMAALTGEMFEWSPMQDKDAKKLATRCYMIASAMMEARDEQ